MKWLIYGANGYTGELIAREAKKRGLSPVLGGRSADKVGKLATELGFEQRVFPIDDGASMAAHLDGIGLVLHCAGPFSATSAPMIDACIRAKAHYLDITGEIAVFEHAQTKSAAAKTAGVVVCPGVGFDVIPTDCVAAALKEALPDATHLALGFDSNSVLSAGTAKTTVEGIPQGGKVRRNGKIVDVPHAHATRRIDFGKGEKLAMSVPWGDVSTAFYTTGVPDIEVFVPTTPMLLFGTRQANHFGWLLGSKMVQDFLKGLAAKSKGPTAEQLDKQSTYVWGEATNARGEKKTARIRTANGYAITVTGALAVAEFLLKNRPEGGTYTPARLMGPDLVTKLPGSSPLSIS
ncbi:MAG: saccharopine dehydrogenase NADP-binding domain-containing protein [Polyangiaceae bacterium]